MSELMLDETHEYLPTRLNDHNEYIFGRFSGHNVVIALPIDAMGIGSAATVAAQLLRSFPRLRFGVLVGIGVGAPSEKNDIRLGDIVVSKPIEAHGGVIAFDFGKQTPNGHYSPTGSLRQSPRVFRRAIATVQVMEQLGVLEISKHMSSVFSKFPDLSVARNPGVKNDLIFPSDYIHQEENDSKCELCDIRSIVSRTPRSTLEPLIHYGLIASGNVVIKNVTVRDFIQNNFDVPCFEGELQG